MLPLRTYQQETIDALYYWWQAHPAIDQAPILELPTGSGKSVIIAELVRLMFDTWPEYHPRTLVIVPSKELAEQNAEKLAQRLPNHISLGYYSASVGQKRPDADVIVATIGSVAKNAHLLGNISAVVVDECHMINPDGAGQYRQLLRELAKYCTFRVVGLTATPFRGNGVWLTDGKAPLFCAIAHRVTVTSLLEAGYLAPLVRPVDVMQTRIDTSGISTAGGDYATDDLDRRVSLYLESAADEAVNLAAERHHWIAFTPSIESANTLRDLLNERGISTEVVTGKTPKFCREKAIASFKAGRVRCLVTVLALATGFDAPMVDCILWLRPTISPVLYVQGAGRGLRIAAGKSDCLWLDFSDTTDRLGPVDTIKGRKRQVSAEREAVAPHAICPECGAQVTPASLSNCPECGAVMREPVPEAPAVVSTSAVMSYQAAAPQIEVFEVTRVTYSEHTKAGSPPSMRVDYYSGMSRVASEWICPEHGGFAAEKAAKWLRLRLPVALGASTSEVLDAIESLKHASEGWPREPVSITVNTAGKYPTILNHTFG